MSCGRAVRPAEGVFAKFSRMKRSMGRGLAVCGGGAGGFARMSGECTVAKGRQCGMGLRSGMSRVSHGPELAPPLFTLIHQQATKLLFRPRLKCPPQPQARVRSFSIPPSSTLMSSFSASPSIITSQPSSPHDLRHVIPTGALTPQKDAVRERKLSAHASQHLGLRVGSRSPTSIPSSPTSVYVHRPYLPVGHSFFCLFLCLPFYSVTANSGTRTVLIFYNPLTCSRLNVSLPNIYPQSLVFVRHL